MSSPLLKVEGLRMEYGNLRVLDEVTFTLERGETVGLFGRSGSGKTTVGKCILLLEEPSSGKIIFRGQNMLTMSKREISQVRPTIQMIFQHPESSLNPRMKLFHSIAEPLQVLNNISRSNIQSEVLTLVNLVGLKSEHLERLPRQLSGGEIQRAILARIFALKPQIVVADEPTSMLDVSVQAQILRLMENIQAETGVSYLFISHDLEVLRAVCHRIAHLEGGHIKAIEYCNRSSSVIG